MSPTVAFQWRHLPASLGALAFCALIARDQLAMAPPLVVLPALLGLASGLLGRALGLGVGGLFFCLLLGTATWFQPEVAPALPQVLATMLGGALLGAGLVGREEE